MNRTLFSIIITGGILLTACAPKEKPSAEAATTDQTTAAAPAPVSVIPVTKTRIARTIDYTATVQAYEEVNMAPSTPGRVDKIYVEVGDRVKKGDKLFLMDRTQYYANKIQLATLQKDLARMDTLLKVGSITEQAYDQMKAQYEVTKTNVDFMEDNTLLEAPFSGVITGKYLEEGELYTGSPAATGKSAVVTLMEINPVKVIVNVSEQSFPYIKNGMKARVVADVYPDREFTGRVFNIHPTIDPMTRTFKVEIEIPNNSELLRPGMFARVYIDMGEVDAVVVPTYCVLLQEGTNDRYLFVEENGVAVRRSVELGKRFDDMVEIAGGNIRENENLIVEGQARLSDGQKVDIKK